MANEYWGEKACLVTGASAGLGRSIAQALACRGANVCITARRSEPLEQAALELRETAQGEVITLAGDMVWEEDVQRLRETIRERWGRLDLLCNGVGRSARRRVLETTPEDFQQLWDANMMATVRCTRAFSDMLTTSSGHLVNIGSLASKVGAPLMGAYPAAKHALAAYTQQIRMEHADAGLHAMLVCPGPIAGSDVSRYAEQARDLPPGAVQPGAGAKLNALDPDRLAEKILRFCERRKPELVAPGRVRCLLALAQLSPRLGDYLVRRFTSS